MRRALLLTGVALWFVVPADALLHLGAPSGGTVDRWFDITSVRATVHVSGRLATTHLDQTFHNRGSAATEGLGELCLPPRAIVTGLAVWSHGQRLAGAAIPAVTARESYQACVTAAGQRPALATLAGDVYRLHVFPVPARSTCRVEVEYLEVLPWQQGTLRYRLPLTTPDSSGAAIGTLTVEVRAGGLGAATVAMGSPFQPLAVIGRPAADSLTVVYADEEVAAAGDWQVEVTPLVPPAGPWVASVAPQAAEAGYYAVWATPPAEPAGPALPRGLTLAVDASSSMVRTRWAAVHQATSTLLAGLRPDDAFGLVVFGNQAQVWPLSPVRADSTSVAAALGFLRQQPSLGATDYSVALQSACALAYPDRRTNQVILVTDGAPTLGETDAGRLAAQARDAAPGPITVSAVGVGDRIDSGLLGDLCRRLDGVAVTVPDAADLAPRLASALLDVAYRAMVTVRMQIDGSDAFDVVTEPDGASIAGQELTQVGRYRTGGDLTLALTSGPPAAPVTVQYPVALAAAADTGADYTAETLFSDDFIDTRGGWQQLPGTEGQWTLDPLEGVYRVAVDGYSWIWVRVPATAYTIQARVCPGSWSTTIVYANADQSVTNRVDLMANLGGESGLRLIRTNSAMVVVPFPVTVGQWYTLQVEVGDGTVTTYVDGRLVHDHVPTPGVVQDGALGISSYGPTHEAQFDYVRVYAGTGLGAHGAPTAALSPLAVLWARQQWQAQTRAYGLSAATARLGTTHGLVTSQTALLASSATATAWLEQSAARDPVTAVNEPPAAAAPGVPSLGPRLAQNAPNPFNASTTLRVWLPAEGATRDLHLSVYNLAGQQIRAWAVAAARPGEHAITWDGRDDDGQEVASGVYLVRLQWGAAQVWRRAALVR